MSTLQLRTKNGRLPCQIQATRSVTSGPKLAASRCYVLYRVGHNMHARQLQKVNGFGVYLAV
jgi:hypothetical protein